MEAILKYLIERLEALGYPGLVALLAAIGAGAGAIGKLVVKLHTLRRQHRLNRDLFPWYTDTEIQRATQYYVETKCQNVAPSKHDEPNRGYAVATKEKILEFFLKKAFKPAADDGRFYIVLADSGMGKTTFLLNLYLRYHEQFFGAPYRMKLFPLGNPDTDAELDKMPDAEKHQTILLLDAFDEDIRAVEDYGAQLRELIRKTSHFREVVLTCRTQFFPSEEEEPKETGVMRYGTDGGEHVFYKFYLSPFDEDDIRVYLRKRFPWFQRAKRRNAQRIVQSCPNLMVRPMLLSYIEDLLKSGRAYTSAYQIYMELIDRWIERETHKVPPNRRKHYMEELYQFSREIAVDLYRKREQRQGKLLISGTEIQPFAEKHSIQLSEMEMKSRSLLNRNARGEYKFSHKSILEYFLAEEAFFNSAFRKELNFEGMEQAETFFDEMIWEKLTIPFFNRSIPDGEYSVKDGRTRVLIKLSEKILPDITMLKLQAWKEEDDVLLFRGLKHLKRLSFGILTSMQESELRQALPKCKIEATFRLPLRSEPLTVSDNDAANVFGLRIAKREKINVWRPVVYIQNEYEGQKELVFDRTTGLFWQKAGSNHYITYEAALNYVAELNDRGFAGFADWRLPTIPELMSLLEPEKQSNNLYINPVFDKCQRWCWSSDKRSPESAWSVNFVDGYVLWYSLLNSYYVRAVRSRQC